MKQLEKIELMLYEKNEYTMLHNIIDYIQTLKRMLQPQPPSLSNASISKNSQNDEAFYFNSQEQSLIVNNNIIIETNEIISAIKKSQMSLNKKEQLVYNLIQNNSINKSNLKHVTLEDILNVSYQPQKENQPLSFLSSIPIQSDIKKSVSQQFNQRIRIQDHISSISPIREKTHQDTQKSSFILNKNDQSSVINLDEFMSNFQENIQSPKFQFSQISPIKNKTKDQLDDLKLLLDNSSATNAHNNQLPLQTQNMVWIDSFRHEDSKKQIQIQQEIQIPKIDIASLQREGENQLDKEVEGIELKRSNSVKRAQKSSNQQKGFFSKSHSRENKENEDINTVKEFRVEENKRNLSDVNFNVLKPKITPHRKGQQISSDQTYLSNLVSRINNKSRTRIQSNHQKPLVSFNQQQDQNINRDKVSLTFHQPNGSITTPKDIICKKKKQFQFLNDLMGKIYMNKNPLYRQRTQTSQGIYSLTLMFLKIELFPKLNQQKKERKIYHSQIEILNLRIMMLAKKKQVFLK